MGLKKTNVTLKNGLVANELYYRINNMNVAKNDVIANIYSFVSYEAYLNNAPVVESYIYNFTPNLNSSDNLFIQCYNFLKTLPEYSNAIDVLE